MQRRSFAPEAKLKAVREVIDGVPVRTVAKGLQLHENLLRRWVKAYKEEGERAFSKESHPKSEAEREVTRLKREIARLRAERDELASSQPAAPEKASITKSMLLDATEKIMVNKGYAAVSTRAVAKEIGVTPALVHYYFPTTDDLLLAAVRRKKDYHDDRVQAALAAANPIRALWNFYSDQERNAVGMEFRAMSNNRKAIRSELATDIEQSRREQVKGIAEFLRRTKVDGELPNALCLVMLIVSMGRAFVGEEVMGVTYGHSEAKSYIEGLLRELERLIDARSPDAEDTEPRARRRRREALAG